MITTKQFQCDWLFIKHSARLDSRLAVVDALV